MLYEVLIGRLQNLINRKPAQAELCRIVGISPSAMANRQNRNSDFSDSEIEKINNAFNINLYSQEVNAFETVEKVTIDYYPDVFGSCGNGAFALSETKERITIPKKAFFANFSPVKKYSVVTAHGNSMEPLIYDNDKVIVEHYEGGQIIDNKPYIFCYQDEIYIKRLAKNVNQLVIMPENKIYDIIKLTKEEMNDINIIGQIVGLIRDLR